MYTTNKTIVLILTFVLSIVKISGQSKEEKNSDLEDIYHAAVQHLSKETDSALYFIKLLQSEGEGLSDQKFYIKGIFLEAQYYCGPGGDINKGVGIYKAGIEIAIENNRDTLVFSGRNDLAVTYRKVGFNDSAALLNEMNLKHGIELNDHLFISLASYNLSSVYMDQEKYQDAVNYSKTVINSAKIIEHHHIKGYGHVGVGVGNMNMGNDSIALEQFKLACDEFLLSSSMVAHNHTKANVAEIFLKLGALDSADYYIRSALAFFSEDQYPREKTFVLETAGKIFFETLDQDSGVYYLQQALQLATEYQFLNRQEVILNTLSSHCAEQSNYMSAYNYFKEYQLIHDSLHKLEKEKVIQYIQTELQVEQIRSKLSNSESSLLAKEAEIELLEMKRQNLNLLIILICVIAFLAAIVLVYYFRKEKQIAKNKLDLKGSELKRVESLNKLKDQKLESLIEQVRTKGEMVERLSSELSSVFETNSEAISELSQMKILTEDDWRKFKKLFSEVYPEFLSNATLRSFSLSTAELRLLMLLKINLTTKEIASSLGVSDGAIRTTKYRILKKTKEAGIDDIQTLLDET